MASVKYQTHIFRSATKLLIESIISWALCFATAVCVQAQDPQKSSGDESWTTTRENTAQNVNPSRTTESHTKSGNRTVDDRKLEVLGLNGRYQPFSETETETIQVDATTTRTVVRTYQWNGNGQRILAQVAEENSRTTAGGDVRMERKTSTADVNGNFQVVRREIADTKKISTDVEETKSTVSLADSYGGFTQTAQTQESKTRRADDSVAVKKTTLTPDGNGNWKINDITERTIKEDGKSRTTDERVSRPDLNGRLQESSHTVSKEAGTGSGERKTVVETYDGGRQLNKRVTTIQKRDSGGEITQEQIEQPNLGNPSDGMKVTGRTKYVVQYAGPGTQQSKTVEIHDANGNFKVVAVETQKSTQAPPGQQSEAPKP
jgi:hypothetical protein